MKCLIIGFGSIAKKHITALRRINPEVQLFALRSNKTVSSSIDGVKNVFTLKEVENINIDFIIISSPSAIHLDHLRLVSHLNIPTLVEKPFLINKEQINQFEEIKQPNQLIYVACNLRFYEPLVFLKNYLNDTNQKIVEVNSYCGSYLPDWRPNTDYRHCYSASAEMGGGVHLDLIHEPDYICHLFGMPSKTIKSHRRVSQLEIDSFDSSVMVFEYPNFNATILLNYFRVVPRRTLEIIRESDILELDFISGKVIQTNRLGSNSLFEYTGSMLDTYEIQLRFFLNCIKKGEISINDANEAIKILNLVI